MKKETMIKYNLQFFAEEGESDGNSDDTSTDESTGSSGDNEDGLDTEAFAELISEKDKNLQTFNSFNSN